MNKVILSGRLTRDVETKHTQNNTTWLNTGIAVDRPTKDKTADFFNLVAWGKTAEVMGKHLSKGSKIIVEGRLQSSTYEKDGAKRNSVTVVVETFEFMESKASSQNRKQSNSNDDLGFDPDDIAF